MIVFKTPKRHKKSAAEGGRLLRPFFRLLYNHFLRVQNEICTYWVCLMELFFPRSSYVVEYWFSRKNTFLIEVRDSPHGIFGSCTRYPRGLTRWAELLGRRRRRRRRRRHRQLVSPGGYRPPDPPPCLSSKGTGDQNVRSHTRMLGPSVYPAYLARGGSSEC